MNYSLQGELIKEYKIPFSENLRATQYVQALSKDYLALYSVFEENKLAIYSKVSNTIIKRFHSPALNISTLVTMLGSPFYSYLNSENKRIINFYETNSNQIYTLDESGIRGKYIWDFESFNFNADEIPDKEFSFEERTQFLRKNQKRWIFKFSNNLENNQYIFTKLLNKGQPSLMIYNKKTKENILFEKMKEENWMGFRDMSNNNAIAILESSKLNMYNFSSIINNKNKEILTKNKNSVNPFIVKCNFR